MKDMKLFLQSLRDNGAAIEQMTAELFLDVEVITGERVKKLSKEKKWWKKF